MCLTSIAVPMTYWSGNPNSFAWLSSSRPLWPGTCDIYDNWRQGLSNYTNTYGAALVAKGPAAVQANFASRRFVFARGTADYGNDASDCAPASQGPDRGARFFNFLRAFPPRAPQLVDYFPGIGHDAPTIFSSPAGLQRFFFDNWDGAGVFAPDAGPRMMPGDDPAPDPNYQAKWGNYTGPYATLVPVQPTPTNVAAVSLVSPTPAPAWNYQGCYNDSSTRAILNNLWSGNSNATVETCVNACAGKGYTVAGLESGTDCWCSSDIRNGAAVVPDSQCMSICAGTNAELCGGSWTVAVYSPSKPFVYTGPKVVPSVGPYNSIGCWTDTGGARTLSGKTPGLGQGNTIETCASACTGFNFFGVEYGQEVSPFITRPE
jgi:hypothetical protein